MDPILLIGLIVVGAILVMAIFAVLECMEWRFHKDRSCNGNSSPSSPYIVGNHFVALTDEPELEQINVDKCPLKPHPIVGVFDHLQRGSQNIHAQGLCNVGGGAWGNAMSVSGRAATTNNWAPVSGGPFDRCQCEDNGGFH